MDEKFSGCSSHKNRFQWAYLQIKQVLELPTEEDIRSKLGKLPAGLKEAYDEIYNKIAKYEHAKVLVDCACMWVMSACTPLSSDELLYAINSDRDTIHLASKITESSLLALCNNLLVLDSQRKVWRFSHLSVTEYFEDNHWDLRQAHCYAAKVCLKLLIKTYGNPTSESKVASSGDKHDSEPQHIYDLEQPFQIYLRHHWAIHVRTYEERVAKEVEADPTLARLLKTFLGSPGQSSVEYQGWYRQIVSDFWGRPSSSVFNEVNEDEISPENVTVCVMCRFSFYTLLRDWWDNAEIDLSQTNRSGDNLLVLAAAAGCKLICESLIKRGMLVNMPLQSGWYGSALAAAA